MEDYLISAAVSIDPLPTAFIKKNFTGLKYGPSSLAGLPQLGHGMGYDSGRLAIYIADRLSKPDTIYLLGFDMGGTNLYHDIEFITPDNYHLAWTGLAGVVQAELVIVSDTEHKYKKELENHYRFISYPELGDEY